MKKTVCVVMPGYHNTVHNFCNELSSYFRVFLLLPRKGSPTRISGSRYHLVRLPSISPVQELPLTPSIISAVRKTAADVIITGEDFQPNTALLALFHRHHRKPLIVINHKYFFSRIPYLLPFHRIILSTLTKRFVWRLACKIIPRSSEAKRFVISNGASLKKVEVISMGIDTPDLPKVSHRVVNTDCQLRMITVARLIPLKGIQYLVEAIRILKNEGICVHLTVVGDGPLGGPLRDLVRLWKLQDQVRFSSYIPHDELLETYREFHAYVQPSTVEVVGLAALEALASGLALVVSDIGGLKDIVQDGQNGYRVPAADPVALAGAIRMLANNPADVERMGVESHKRARELFSWEVVTEKYVNAITFCLD